MIRAVVKNGVFQPLDPLPLEWDEGHVVQVEDTAAPARPEDREDRYQAFLQVEAARYEPGEQERLDALMRDADEEAKAHVRRQMGLATCWTRITSHV